MIAPLLALALAAVDPCAPVQPVPPDPVTAQAYREVADAELAADHATAPRRRTETRSRAIPRTRPPAPRCSGSAPRTALIHSRTGSGVWTRRTSPAPRARSRPRSPRTGTPRRRSSAASRATSSATTRRRSGSCARPSENPAHREEARFYLGLLAPARRRRRAGVVAPRGRRHEPRAREPRARFLARLARRDGRLILSLVAESGWDSNVNLGPGGPEGPAAQSDGTAALSASILWRPSGARGPYLRAAGLLHNLAQLDAYDSGRRRGGGRVAAQGREARRGGRVRVRSPDPRRRRLPRRAPPARVGLAPPRPRGRGRELCRAVRVVRRRVVAVLGGAASGGGAGHARRDPAPPARARVRRRARRRAGERAVLLGARAACRGSAPPRAGPARRGPRADAPRATTSSTRRSARAVATRTSTARPSWRWTWPTAGPRAPASSAGTRARTWTRWRTTSSRPTVAIGYTLGL